MPLTGKICKKKEGLFVVLKKTRVCSVYKPSLEKKLILKQNR